MAVWAGTLTAVTAAGFLQLNEGASFGRYVQASTDIAGYIGYFNIDVEFEWEESPAGQKIGNLRLFIDTSDDDIAWDGWRRFRPGEYTTRYYKLRVDFHGNAAENQRPKLTRLEVAITPAYAEPRGTPVISTLNNPPANPDKGDRHIVGTGAAAFLNLDGKIVTYIETTSDTFITEEPHEGKKVYHLADKEDKIQDDSGEWVSCDGRTTAPFSQNQHTNDIESENGGPWTLTIDNAQDGNAYYENTAGAGDGDFITFKIGAKVGSYDLRWLTVVGPNCGSIDIQFDGVVKATFDCYAVGLTKNSRFAQAAIAVAVAKTIVVKIVVNGKNPASGGFELYHTRFNLAPA